MEKTFERLKIEGKTDVDSLVQWLKESKVIEDAKAAEEKARALFNDCADKKAVEFIKFKEAIGKLASEKKQTIEDLWNNLSEQGPKLLNAVKAGASAFREALAKQ